MRRNIKSFRKEKPQTQDVSLPSPSEQSLHVFILVCMSRQKRVLSAFLWELRRPFRKPFFSGHDSHLPENSPQQHSPAPPYNSKQGRQHKETIAWFISMHWFPGGDAPSFCSPLNYRALLSLVFISSLSRSSGHVRKGPARWVFDLSFIFISYRAPWVLGFGEDQIREGYFALSCSCLSSVQINVKFSRHQWHLVQN